MDIKLLILPGYGGSGSGHWQTYWENEYEYIERVEQQDWDKPKLEQWVTTLESCIQKHDEPIILVAHSLACSLIAHWASMFETKNILGALLVSPADIESEKHTPNEIRNFSPMPLNKLPFKSIVVASNNDPYVALERAEYFSNAWGSHFIDYGSYGHINADSGLDSWNYGKSLIERLAKKPELRY